MSLHLPYTISPGDRRRPPHSNKPQGRPRPLTWCLTVLTLMVVTLSPSPTVHGAAGTTSPTLTTLAPSLNHERGGPHPPAHYLLLSNSPETVRQPGTLFQEEVEPGLRYRLFFHHLNATGHEADLRISLQTVEKEFAGEARLTVAGMGTSHQPFTSGWLAAEAYALSSTETTVHRLDPRARAENVIWRTPLPSGQVATGYMFLEVEQPTVVQVRLGQGDDVLPRDGVHPRGIFSYPQIDTDITFSLRDRILDIPFGASGHFRDVNTDMVLRGDWGIDYRLRLTVENPFDVPMPLHLLFIPKGGDGRLLTMLDGRVYTTPRTFSGHYFLVHRWVIHPGRTRVISLWTTPISAMGYPAILRLSTHVDAGWPRHPTSP